MGFLDRFKKNNEPKSDLIVGDKELEQKEENESNYIRRERVCSYQRSFYVGDVVTEQDIKAKYNNGTLELTIPKLERKEIPTKHIEID